MVVTNGAGYLERPRSSGLAEVIDIILDKGIVIDAFVRVSVLGLELLTIDARIVVASVDTYLRYAEAVDRLVLEPASTTGVADLAGGLMQNGARSKTKGALEGAKESVRDTLGLGEDEDEDDEEEPRRQRRPARKKARSSS